MTNELLVQEREVVVPGQILATGMGYLPGQGAYRDDTAVKANRIGLVMFEGKVIKLIPLSGVYAPKIGDKVVAQVIDVLMSGWRLDLSCPYSAVLSTKDGTSSFIGRGKDLTEVFAIDDVVVGKIVNVTSQKLVDVTMKAPGARKLPSGRLIKVNPHKVPRIIGKEGTMIGLLRQATGVDMVAGQNGLVWMSGHPKDEVLVTNIIRKIESEAHMPGLTDRVKEMLKEHGKTIPDHIAPEPEQQEREHYGGGGFHQGGGFQPRGPPGSFQRPVFQKPSGDSQ